MQQQAINNGSYDLEKLLAEHRALNQKVDELEQRVYLSPAEEFEVQQLKKLRLQKKDLIQGVRNLKSS
ncbi:MAG: YdcH family protein [Deltaproteobacteria bacterium]|nr:YdcH family protein [Deltaproteobacteria bacterium]